MSLITKPPHSNAGASRTVEGFPRNQRCEDKSISFSESSIVGPDVRWDWPIIPSADGTFQWAVIEGGRKHAHAIEVEPEFGVHCDVVAWFWDQPDRWWTLRGSAVLLGKFALQLAEQFGRSINLYPTPATWLKASAQGDLGAACILDWDVDPRSIFSPGFKVKCSPPILETKLRQRHSEVTAPQYEITT